MLDIALFGGAFNPIGLHHEKIAELIKLNFGMNSWMMPCYNHMFAKNDCLVESFHRLSMIEKIQSKRADGLISAFDWEIKTKHKGSMFETVQSLKQQMPEINFHIVVGMDNANILQSKWHKGKELVEQCSFVVIKRSGVNPSSDWIKEHKLIEFESDSSSTIIRESIKVGDIQKAQSNLNSVVWDYIVQNELYGFKK